MNRFFSVTDTHTYGVHGYDNKESSMHALFMAKGELFGEGKILRNPVNVVDLYNIFCKILQINCTENDGEKDLKKFDELFTLQ